jgi:hypothetical protein
MTKLIAVAALAVCAALPASASAGRYPQPNECGTGEPAYTGWNYTDLEAYGLACRNAHNTAEEYVYDFSTEGVIEPPRHWDRCKDKKVAKGVFKGKCARLKGNEPQKITFLFGGPEQDWYRA